METQTTGTPETDSEDFATLFAQSEANSGQIEEGKVVSGTVIQLTKDYAVVDIGYKSEGQVAMNEFVAQPGAEPAVKVGDRVEGLGGDLAQADPGKVRPRLGQVRGQHGGGDAEAG